MRLRLVRAAAALAFVLQFVVLDLITRPETDGRAIVVRLASALLWTLALVIATTPRRELFFGALAALLVVVQLLVYRYYHATLDVQVAATALHAYRDVRPVLVAALPGLAVGVAVTTALELGALRLARPLVRARRPVAGAAGLLFASALGLVVLVGPRHATPEIAAAHATTALGATSPRAPRTAGAVSLPPLLSTRDTLPDVLFVLTESVRASDYLARGDGATARATAEVTPGRGDLRMRSVSSYTAVSVSALLTGRSQEGARDDVLRAPNLFDVAFATRDARGARPTVLYVSAQSETVFEAKDVRASIDRFVTVEAILGRDVEDSEYMTVPLDRLVTERFEHELGTTRGPVFAVLHLASTHAPYFVDEADAPFAPYSHVVTWSGLPDLRRAYLDAIHAQDRVVARTVRSFVAREPSRPKVVFFTSDHGEAFGEHGAIHHGQNLYDEQLLVPAWLWATDGALSPRARAALSERHAATHLDVFPTLLDVLGLAGNTALRDVHAALRGRSLLAPPSDGDDDEPVPITNCTGLFPCPLDTWGLLTPERKLVAQRWDGDWRCLALDGEEHAAPPGDATCARLRERSRAVYATKPNGAPNR